MNSLALDDNGATHRSAAHLRATSTVGPQNSARLLASQPYGMFYDATPVITHSDVTYIGSGGRKSRSWSIYLSRPTRMTTIIIVT
jgi:hypothetical protein